MNATLRKLLGLAVRTSRIVRRNPKDLRFLLGHADYAASLIDDPDGDVRDVPEIDFGELTTLFGGTIRYEVQSFAGVPASVSPLEANAIALIVRSLPTRVAFEFGTYKGISTTQIALNLAMNGVVHTIDLPEDDPTASLSISDSYERELTREGGKGHLIPSELLGRVRFHSTDSAHFDEEPFAGCADFVFVDGAHSSEYVTSDSEKSWRMLRPGGVIVWHDCVPTHPDVVRYVRSAQSWNPRRIFGTALAFAIKHD